MPSLAESSCGACHADSQRLTLEEMPSLLAQIPDWHVVEREQMPRLERVFTFPDFAGALAFANRVGALAEEHNHHPAILTEWGRVTITWWTHAIKGLHYNDFVMAAKTDGLLTSS